MPTNVKLDYATYAASGVIAVLELVSATVGKLFGSAFLFMQSNASGITVAIVVMTFLMSQFWSYRNDKRARAREQREAAEHRYNKIALSMGERARRVADSQHERWADMNDAASEDKE